MINFFSPFKKHTWQTIALCVLFVIPLFMFADETVNISAIVGTETGGGGGEGSGGGGVSSPTEVIFSGRAYPYSPVIVLKNGIEIVETVAGGDAKFQVTVSGLSTGSYTFSILAEDDAGRRSTLYTFPLYISRGVSTTISGIYIAPTIAIDKSVVQQGDTISIFGQSTPDALITITVNSLVPHFISATSDSDGIYLSVFNTGILELGAHTTKSISALPNEASSYSQTLEFSVGTQNIPVTCADRGDLNGDCRVNIIDFSILAFWYNRPLPPAAFDLSHDGQITLVDFSIMAYYWTG